VSGTGLAWGWWGEMESVLVGVLHDIAVASFDPVAVVQHGLAAARKLLFGEKSDFSKASEMNKQLVGRQKIFRNAGTIMPVWQVRRVDPGYLYAIEDNGRFKIGKTSSTKERLKAAKTWLPDMKLIGFKPFWRISYNERLLHIGLTRFWYAGEWFSFEAEAEMREWFVDNFTAFSDDDPDMNSVNFIYWCHDGMLEFQIEIDCQNLTLPKFQRQESGVQKID
jgi:hypothetical protein